MLLSVTVVAAFLALEAPHTAPRPFSGVNRQSIERAVKQGFQPRPLVRAKPTFVVTAEPGRCSIPLTNLLRPGVNPDPGIAKPVPARIDPMPNIMPAPPCPDRP